MYEQSLRESLDPQDRRSADVQQQIPVPDPDEEQSNSPIAAPALGYSILANVGDEKQITVQCFVDSEEPLGSIHSKIDKAMAVVDRQKARYKIKDLRKEVSEMEDALGRLEDDLSRLESDFVAQQDALDVAFAQCSAKVGEINEQAHERNRARPVGADAAQAKALTTEMERLNEQKAKAVAEREQARGNIAVNVGRFQDAIAKKNEEIAECEALIAAGD